MRWRNLISILHHTFNTISRLTFFLSLASLLMNFSTAVVISTSLRIFENIEGLIIVKTLSRSLGYAGQFIIGFLTEIFHCNKLILRIGYGSNFIIKPMFLIACLGIDNLFGLFGLTLHLGEDQIKFINIFIFIIADVLDQFCNNFRDIARDSLIASSVNVANLSRNLSFRKAFSFLGTGTGGLFALVCGFFFPTSGIYLVILFVSGSSVVGYFCLNIALRINSSTENKLTFDKLDSLKDIRFISFVMFFIIFVLFLFRIEYLLKYFAIGFGVLFIIFFYNKNKIGMHLMCNKTFIFSGIFTCFFMMFRMNQYGLLKAFNIEVIFKFIGVNDTHLPKQIFFLTYYITSFLSSFIGSIFIIKDINVVIMICSFSLFMTNILPFILNDNPICFILSVIFYSINSGLYEPLMNSNVVKNSKNFPYKGITLGLFSVFSSMGVSLNIYVIDFFAKNFIGYLLSSSIFYGSIMALTILILSRKKIFNSVVS